MWSANNLVVGTSPNFNCVTDIPPQDLNDQYAYNSAPYGANKGGRIGIVWSNFVDGANGTFSFLMHKIYILSKGLIRNLIF